MSSGMGARRRGSWHWDIHQGWPEGEEVSVGTPHSDPHRDVHTRPRAKALRSGASPWGASQGWVRSRIVTSNHHLQHEPWGGPFNTYGRATMMLGQF